MPTVLMESNTDVFYAALLSPEVRQANVEPSTLVSPDRSLIIGLCRKYKGSRFKSFRTYDEALKYAEEEDPEEIREVAVPAAAEFAPPFPSLESTQLSQFKRLIESQKTTLEEVEAMVEQNPRYLINYSSDDPTILRQGPRYNAVHQAIISKAPKILDYILKTVNSLAFIERCFPNLNEKELLAEKRDHILDAFLNTPDKVSYNTPLHFACRAGQLQCIQVLLEYVPIIDKSISRRNKMGKLPVEMVTDATLRAQIEELFSACMFVTVLRSDDGLDVKVNEPCYGRQAIERSTPAENNKNLSKISTIVGPMTPDRAKVLYETLKSPKRCTPKQRGVRMSDPIRGVEKVALDLSLSLQVSCKEYWPFLDEYVDIATAEGLDKLEEHLKGQQAKCSPEWSAMQRLTEDLNNLTLSNSDTSPEYFYDADSDDDVFYSAPSSPIPEVEESPLMQPIYMTGREESDVDKDVLAALNLAIDNGVIAMDNLKTSHPLLFNWFNLLTSSNPPDDTQS